TPPLPATAGVRATGPFVQELPDAGKAEAQPKERAASTTTVGIAPNGRPGTSAVTAPGRAAAGPTPNSDCEKSGLREPGAGGRAAFMNRSALVLIRVRLLSVRVRRTVPGARCSYMTEAGSLLSPSPTVWASSCVASVRKSYWFGPMALPSGPVLKPQPVVTM